MSKEDLRDEFVEGFVAKLAEYNSGEYLTTEIEQAKAEGRAEARGTTLSTRPIALTEDRQPAGLALDSIIENIRKTNPLGTRIRVSVEIVHRAPGERGGPEDL